MLRQHPGVRAQLCQDGCRSVDGMHSRGTTIDSASASNTSVRAQAYAGHAPRCVLTRMSQVFRPPKLPQETDELEFSTTRALRENNTKRSRHAACIADPRYRRLPAESLRAPKKGMQF
jgi:hypothetical protein